MYFSHGNAGVAIKVGKKRDDLYEDDVDLW